MFGDLDEPDLEGLETDAMKSMHEQAAVAEKTDIKATEGPIPTGGDAHMVVTNLPVPIEFGLQPEMYPETDLVKEPSKRDPSKRVTKFYYACRRCSHSSSMYTHACQCFNIKLVCPVCQKEYKSNKGINRHIIKIHDGKCDMGALRKTEVKEGMTPWSLSSFIIGKNCIAHKLNLALFSCFVKFNCNQFVSCQNYQTLNIHLIRASK